ncbi:hypothetical protein FQV26_09425 [Planococcus sp. CPCC 101016]|uniref:hypothetical protein n=1 Tax=Planococcus sp. CPCC 101016 TaxID=2599617 RepID=UPI0011B69F00|nr:hypothetical protein [Planococcus sp. CPCC 101016]TWT08010.1 hypothetical protein FQV26_09425 [Planococcus sp. CPCC 101016]
MKRLLSILAVLLLFLSACGDYEGTVTEKRDTSFMLEVPSDNSEEEPIFHEMHLTDGTIFKGSISTYEELEEGDKVRVIPFDVPDDFPYFLPAEVIVE